MRLAVITANRFLMGGAEYHLRRLLPALRARGHEVGFLYDRAGAPNAPTVDDGCEQLPVWHADPHRPHQVVHELRTWRPDLLYVHGLNEPELEAALLDSFPAVLCAHNYYGTCISGNKSFRRPRFGPCERRFGPACLALYLPCGCGGRNPRTMWREYQLQARRYSLLRRYRMVLVASRHMEAEYARQGIERSRLHLVPHFPATVAADATPPERRPFSGRILFSGRLTPVKGGHVLIEALARLGCKHHLVVAGSGPEQKALEALAKHHRLRATFLGKVTDAELDRERCSADLQAVPSLWPEPFGLVGVEAGCVGLPTVGFRTGGIADWLIPGETGEAPPEGQQTPQGLAHAIGRALQSDNHHYHLRYGAWQMAQRFTLERHVEVLEPLLAQACHERLAPAHR